MFVLLLVFCVLPQVPGLKVVQTSYGRVRGITEWSYDKNHKYIFKSVPFAKPPLGNLRFAPPQKPESWSGILDASKYSAACMSNSTQTSTPQSYVSEDCLYINIFTSEKCLKNKCPVIVYFHGGAFNLDSATMFPDKFILDRYVTEDVIFAIPAFRLGVFGQLYFGPSAVLTENLLMFDAVQAISYVHNEISNFGGDVNQVTVMGHSSGGTLVDALGFSKLIDPEVKMFQQMIVLSAPGMFGFYDLVVENSFVFAEKLGCYTGAKVDRPNANIAEIVNCLRKIDGHEILRMQRQMEEVDGLNFRSIIRGAPFMELNGKLADLKKETSPRNLVYGTTEHEFRTIKYRNPYISGCFLDFENPVAVSRHFDDMLMDHIDDWINGDTAGIFVSAATYAAAMSNAGANVYLFETRQKPYSFHVSDMQYFIGIHREVWHFKDMDILDTFYSKMLVNFTKTGVPSPKWPVLDPTKMNYLELKVDTKNKSGPVMLDGFHDQEMEFWFGEMTEFDKNVTKIVIINVCIGLTRNSFQRKAQGLQPESHEVSSQLQTEESPQSPILPVTSAFGENTLPSKITTVQTEKEYKKTAGSILSQWWFYLVVALVVMIIVLVIISLVRSKREEETPLLR
ncbi:hypothetical protein CRE_16737 [Caenorhabditis remanei]|uniref:Carboxylic ester hydrolase n=1 Tax=Caenorhabditis remanei TaxID=31234 RepID=E3MAQ8_CAERE|nr:hypothetical protein CRE_16737 [Caenorhabditis remanei]